jgi:hypothetical protein
VRVGASHRASKAKARPDIAFIHIVQAIIPIEKLTFDFFDNIDPLRTQRAFKLQEHQPLSKQSSELVQ